MVDLVELVISRPVRDRLPGTELPTLEPANIDTLDVSTSPLPREDRARAGSSDNGRHIPSMRSEAPALLPIFRSQAQAEILALLLLHPEQEFNLTDLSRRIKAPLTSIHGEVERLVEAAMLAERPGGLNRMVRANLDHPASEPLIETSSN